MVIFHSYVSLPEGTLDDIDVSLPGDGKSLQVAACLWPLMQVPPLCLGLGKSLPQGEIMGTRYRLTKKTIDRL